MSENLFQDSGQTACWGNWLRVIEVSDGSFFCSELFYKKFGHTVPTWGRHIVAFYRDSSGQFLALSYLHFWEQDRAGYIGGGCTDGNIVRAMTDSHKQSFTSAGGALFFTLKYAFSNFDSNIDAFFGLAENPRARAVDLAAGFESTHRENLLIREARPLSTVRREELIQQAIDVGAF